MFFVIDTELFRNTPFREAKGLVLEEKWGLFVHVATIARSPSGTLVVACIGGPRAEPEPDNVIAFARSFDNGETWTPLKGMIDPDDGWRAFDPVLWTRLDGKIWIQWAEGDCPGFRQRDRERRAFCGFLTVDGEEIGIGDVQPWIGHETGNWAVNPPIVLSSGRWIVPMQNGPFQYVRSSDDQGRTWVNREQATTEQVPGGIDEATFVQREDGRLWALYRTTGGRLFEGFFGRRRGFVDRYSRNGDPQPGNQALPFETRLRTGPSAQQRHVCIAGGVQRPSSSGGQVLREELPHGRPVGGRRTDILRRVGAGPGSLRLLPLCDSGPGGGHTYRLQDEDRTGVYLGGKHDWGYDDGSRSGDGGRPGGLWAAYGGDDSRV